MAGAGFSPSSTDPRPAQAGGWPRANRGNPKSSAGSHTSHGFKLKNSSHHRLIKMDAVKFCTSKHQSDFTVGLTDSLWQGNVFQSLTPSESTCDPSRIGGANATAFLFLSFVGPCHLSQPLTASHSFSFQQSGSSAAPDSKPIRHSTKERTCGRLEPASQSWAALLQTCHARVMILSAQTHLTRTCSDFRWGS